MGYRFTVGIGKGALTYPLEAHRRVVCLTVPVELLVAIATRSGEAIVLG